MHAGARILLVALMAVSCRSGSPPPDAETNTPQAAGRPQRVPIEPAPQMAALLEEPDRTAEDLKADARRRPAEVLTFIGVESGMQVGDLAAGAGYTTELLARAVRPEGVVYAQNNQHALENFVGESWPRRLERDVMDHVIRVDREFEDPFPPEAEDLDLVTIVFGYHDVIAQGQDVAKMNAAVYEALRPGGHYVIMDHAAPAGTGTEHTEALHRIDEETVVEQVEAAGFELVERSDFLRDPSDPRDTKVWEVGFETDRFALEFRKPEESGAPEESEEPGPPSPA